MQESKEEVTKVNFLSKVAETLLGVSIPFTKIDLKLS